MITNYKAAEAYKKAGLFPLPYFSPSGNGKMPNVGRGQGVIKEYQEQNNIFAFRKKFHSGVGVFCGSISNGLELLDFDNGDNKATERIKQFVNDGRIKNLIKSKCYIEKSISGGYHIMYKYDAETYEGNRKLAMDPTGKIVYIETRGEGGWAAVYPSKGYNRIKGDLTKLISLTLEERNTLVDVSKEYNKQDRPEPDRNDPSLNLPTDVPDPMTYANFKLVGYAKQLLTDNGWVQLSGGIKDLGKHGDVEQWSRPGKRTGATSATWNKINGYFYVFSSSTDFEPETWYGAFGIICKLRFKGEWQQCTNWILRNYFGKDHGFIKVADRYLKVITIEDRDGFERLELNGFDKREIIEENGKEFIKHIPKFKALVNRPSYDNYEPIIKGCYNMFHPVAVTPKESDLTWTMRLLQHVFGDHLPQGLDYMKILCAHPDKRTKILCIISAERETGKTTFINWMKMLFGHNSVLIDGADLSRDFNMHYSTKNVIIIDEAFVEKSKVVEKLKTLHSAKYMILNGKYIPQTQVDFYGKFVFASNNEDKFMRIQSEETRFWVRKVKKPKFHNTNIEKDLIKEIPAFFYFMENYSLRHEWLTRDYFGDGETDTDELYNTKYHSKNWLYKDIKSIMEEWFLEHENEEVWVSQKDLLNYLSENGSKAPERSYLSEVMKNDFNKVLSVNSYVKPEHMFYKSSANTSDSKSRKKSRVYKLLRDEFVGIGVDNGDGDDL